VLFKKSAKRRQPITFYTSTADYDRESLCNDMVKRAHAVIGNGGNPSKPGYDPAFLPVVYEASIKDDYTKVATWRKANPNLDVTVTKDYMRREARKAKERL